MTDRQLATLNRRTLLQWGGLALAEAASGLSTAAWGQGSLRKLNVQIDYLETIDYSGFFAAQQQGYANQLGVDLVVVPGGPQIDAIQSVAGGSAPVGTTPTLGRVALARAAGVPVKAIATICQKNPAGLISLAKAPIRQPKDAIGKRIGLQAAARAAWAQVAAVNGIKEDQVTTVPVSFDPTPLLSGQVDGFWGTQVNQQLALKLRGIETTMMLRADIGCPEFFLVLFAMEDFIAKERDLIVRWLKASIRGTQYWRANPDKMAEFVVSRAPALKMNLAHVKAQAVAELDFVAPPGSSMRLMEIDPAQATKAISQLADIGQLTKPMKLSDVFDPSLLEAAYGGLRAL